MNFFGKRFFAIALLLCLSFSLFACSFKKQPVQQGYPQVTTEKEKTPEELIIGTWVAESIYVFADGKSYVSYDSNMMSAWDIDTSDFLFTFLDDRSVLGYESSVPYTFGYWQLIENTLLLTAIHPDSPEMSSSLEYSIIQLDEDTLIMRDDSTDLAEFYDYDGEIDYVEYTYRRQGN